MSDCKIGKNTGFPDCVTLFSKVVGFGLIDMTNSLGESNKLAYDPDTYAWLTTLQGMIVNQDKSKRLYPVKGLLNVKPTREDDQYETAADGTKAFLRDGLTQYDFEHWNSSNVFYSKLKDQCACTSRRGAFLYTREGIIVYKKGNEFFPVELSMLNAYYMPASDSNVPKTMISMQFAAEIEISNLWLIEWSDLGSSLESQLGLIDVEFDANAFTAGGNAQVWFSASSSYNKNKKPSTLLGLTPTNLVFKNVATGAAATPIQFLYQEAIGKYRATFLTATSGLDSGSKVNISMFFGRYEGSETITID